MSNANKLIDKWMEVCAIKTQTEAAKRLGKAGSATISNWRSGYAKPDNESIAQMCEECGESAAHWIGLLNLDFEESPRLKKVWAQLAKVAAALTGVYLLCQHGLDGQTASAFMLSPCIHYAKYWVRTYPCPRSRNNCFRYVAPSVFVIPTHFARSPTK